MRQTFLRLPFLRLIIPCILGIIWSYYFNSHLFMFILFSAGCFALIVYCFFDRYKYRYCFGVGISGFLFLIFAFQTKNTLSESDWENFTGMSDYYVKILEEPVAKNKTLQCQVFIISVQDTSGVVTVNKRGILYISNGDFSNSFTVGDCLYVHTLFRKPEKDISIPFDYAGYLKNKGIAAVGFARPENIKFAPVPETIFPDLKSIAYANRKYLLGKLKQIIPSEEQYGIAAGILFGDKNSLDDDLKAMFSSSGGAHVLVVSGLHLGFLYAILLFILKFLGNTRKISIVKQIIILLILWFFSFITGLAPSIIRATTMLSIYGIAQVTGKRNFSLNTVGSSAFIMLLYNPLYLFDVGFQLSFSAVVAIISINPFLQHLYKSRYSFFNYIYSLLSVSVSAQAGTAPLSVYYFHQFPVVFLLTNLFVIPLTGLVLILTSIYLLLTCLVSLPAVMLFPLHFTLQLFIDGIEWITSIPYASLTGLMIDKIGVFFLYMLFVFIVLLFVHKKIIYLCILLLLVLFQLIYYL